VQGSSHTIIYLITNHRTSLVRRGPERSSGPTPGSAQDHPNPNPNLHTMLKMRPCKAVGHPLPSTASCAGSEVQLALLAARAHCWLRLNLLSSRTPRFPYIGLLSCLLSSNLYIYSALSHPRCRIWRLLLFNFT